jgi:hypothetical protein
VANRLTDRHVACILRAVRMYREHLHGEIQDMKDRRAAGKTVDDKALAEKVAEKECVNEATTLLWHEHADRVRDG